MRLNEFADPKKYVMKLVKRMERVLRDFGAKTDAPVFSSIGQRAKERETTAGRWSRIEFTLPIRQRQSLIRWPQRTRDGAHANVRNRSAR